MAGADYGHLIMKDNVEVLPDPEWGFTAAFLTELVGKESWGEYGLGRYGFFSGLGVGLYKEGSVTELHNGGNAAFWRVDNHGAVITGVSGYYVGREFECVNKRYGVSGRQIKKANQKLLSELNAWLKTL